MIIHALVRARLLGMQLLTLEARVIVDDEDASSRRPPPSPRPELACGPGSEYERAVKLLEQGARALNHGR